MNKAIYSDYTPMEWPLEHSLEVPELDRQHKELMRFFNDALDNCSGEKAEEKEYFDKTIDAFVFLLEKHFETEEQFLFGSNYSRYEEHKLEHRKLLEKIYFIKNEIQNNKWEMKLHILAITLKSWFMYHFNSYDISAKEYFGEGSIIPISAGNYFAFQS